MQALSPDQAQALWNAGGFIVITDLPEGSEYSLDGTQNVISSKFNGSKFVPPGPHLITISPPSGSSSTDVGLSVKSGYFRYFKPRERLVLSYDESTESLKNLSERDGEGEEEEVISDDSLKSLDGGLAAYPFEGLDQWKRLTGYITDGSLLVVLGPKGSVDGMRGCKGDSSDLTSREKGKGKGKEEEMDAIQGAGDEKGMNFVSFDLRRSWRDGAVGEEVTKFSKDKSWLFGDILSKTFDNDSALLFSQFQLSFTLFLYLSSISSLEIYKCLLPLFTRSSEILLDPSKYIPERAIKAISQTWIQFIQILTAQLEALPSDCFEVDLVEMDIWFLEEINYLTSNISAALGREGSVWPDVNQRELQRSWAGLREMGKKNFGWVIDALSVSEGSINGNGEEEEEEEEGEYAPVVVEL